MQANQFAFDLKWWVGVIEDRHDPEEKGRVKVRIRNFHTADKSNIPTESLPWAEVVIPMNGLSFARPREGSQVFGFFKDNGHQFPVVVGIISGSPENTAPGKNVGFGDSDRSKLKDRPVNRRSGFRPATIPDSGVKATRPGEEEAIRKMTGSYPFIEDVGQPDYISRLARGYETSKTVLNWKIDNRVLNVPKNGKSNDAIKQTTWSEPNPITNYASKYPFNSVVESESGHVFEVDDTLGYERIHTFHRSGTHDEMLANGDRVQKTVGDNYRIVHGDDYYFCFGTKHESFGGDKSHTYYSDMGCIIGGDYWNIVHGNSTNSSKGSISSWSGKDTYFTASKGMHIVGDSGVFLSARNKGLHLKSDKNLYIDAGEDIHMVSMDQMNLHSIVKSNLISNGTVKIVSGCSTQVHSQMDLQLSSTMNASLSSSMSLNIGSNIMNIYAGGIATLTGNILLINCGFAVPEAVLPKKGAPVDFATAATHAGQGDGKIPDPGTLSRGIKD